MPHWLWAIIIVLIVLIILFLAFCAYAGNFFVGAALLRDSTWYAEKGHKMLNPDNFNTEKTVWTEIEDRQNKERDEFWDRQASESWEQEIDGHKIVATAFRNSGHRWLLGVHGYRSTGKRDMGYTAKIMFEKGYSVLVPDLSAHGKSGGNKIGMGWLERRDVEIWIKEIVKRDPEAQITLIGGSMGAATVLMTSGDDLPSQVKLIIADCGYSSVNSVFSYILSSSLHMPAGPVIHFASQACQKKIGVSFDQVSSVNQLAKNKRPLLLIHGTADKFVPYQETFKNMEATQGPVECMLVQKAPHLSSAIYDEERYYETIEQFIDNNLERSANNGTTK